MNYPFSVNDFRPISLLGWVHKLMARVIAAKLRRVLGELVRNSQSAFFSGRSIYEGWIVTRRY